MKRHLLAVVAAAFAMACGARAVEIGKPAPAFEAKSTAGAVKTADFKGRWLVLYFYPKSFTPGCTREACSLRDGYAAVTNAGAAVLGASVDTLEQQKKFKAAHNLPFELIADEDGAVAKAFGVLSAERKMAARQTFVIDPEGRIAAIIADVKTEAHDRQVADTLRSVQKQTK